jgi:predicted dehydrogenase
MPGVDAVYIASPTDLHEKHVLLALQAGLPVLVEKPAWLPNLARTWRSEVLSSGFVQEALMMRTHAWQQMVTQAMRDPDFGQLEGFEILLHAHLDPARLDQRARTDGDVVRDLAPHALQLFQLFAARDTVQMSILGTESQYIDNRLRAHYRAQVCLEGKIYGSLSLSYICPFQASLRIKFARRTLSFPQLFRCMVGRVFMPYSILVHESGHPIDCRFEVDNYFERQLSAFVEGVLGNRRGVDPGLVERQLLLEELCATGA